MESDSVLRVDGAVERPSSSSKFGAFIEFIRCFIWHSIGGAFRGCIWGSVGVGAHLDVHLKVRSGGSLLFHSPGVYPIFHSDVNPEVLGSIQESMRESSVANKIVGVFRLKVFDRILANKYSNMSGNI